MKTRRPDAGFTLIELMVVVIIIAALAGMVLPRVLPMSEEAKKNIAKGDIANISVALKLYKLHMGSYPTDLNALKTKPGSADNWHGPYLETDPNDPWGNAYVYSRNSDPDSAIGFKLSSSGPDEQSGTEDDVANW